MKTSKRFNYLLYILLLYLGTVNEKGFIWTISILISTRLNLFINRVKLSLAWNQATKLWLASLQIIGWRSLTYKIIDICLYFRDIIIL